jgi:DNA-binding transcriptional LysR family regulator
MSVLDVEAVQAFVLVADLKSFTRAAEAMQTTQSAVSLKIKRLEETMGRRLLDRTPRLVRLSAEGSIFLEAARSLLAAHQNAVTSFHIEQRRLVVGISHHIVGAELPFMLKRMAGSEPNLVVELYVASSREIMNDFDHGKLDSAIVLRHDNRRQGGEVLFSESFGWMATHDFEYHRGEKLRLATQADPCSVRSMALSVLKDAGIPWTEVFIGGGITTIGAAVLAGFAVAALGRRVAPPGTIDVGPQLGLPPLPSRDVMLYSNITEKQARRALRTLSAVIAGSSTIRLSPLLASL